VKIHRRADADRLGLVLAKLARWGRALPGADLAMAQGNRSVFRQALGEMSHALHVPADDLWCALTVKWAAVRLPGTRYTHALDTARRFPVQLVGPLAGQGKLVEQLAGLAYWLALATQPFAAVGQVGPFVLPQLDLALVFDVSQWAVSNATNCLLLHKLLLVRAEYVPHVLPRAYAFDLDSACYVAPAAATLHRGAA
jgi:hypothetical protein